MPTDQITGEIVSVPTDYQSGTLPSNEVWFGSASTATPKSGLAADQVHTVNLTNNTTYMAGATIFRASDPATQQALGQQMLNACDNNNILYQYGAKEVNSQADINTQTIKRTDCSGLAGGVFTAVTGINVSGSTSDGSFAASIYNTGLVANVGTYVPGQTQLQVGDILVKQGHTGIITQGASATGWSGGSIAGIGSYGNGYAGGNVILGSYIDKDGNVVVGTQSIAGSLLGGGVGMVNGMFIVPNHYKATPGTYTPRREAPRIFPVPTLDDLIAMVGGAGLPLDQALGLLSGIDLSDFFPDMWFTPESWGGYSPWPYPPLTTESYAWGRFSEIMDSFSQTSRGMAQMVYITAEDGYERNMAPTLGSIMCFSKGRAGYVCVVEDIHDGEWIETSEVNEAGEFLVKERHKRYGSWDYDDYVYQGFIHCPAVSQWGNDESAMETFIRIAEEHVGNNKAWACNKMGVKMNNGWSAAFVTACSATAGSSLNIVIPNTTSCSDIARIGVLRDMGWFLPGPAQGRMSFPQVGDIALFRKHPYSEKVSQYVADGAGIINQVSSGSFTCIEGDNDSGQVRASSYSIGSRIISGYYRPNWAQIDGTTESVIQYRTLDGLYMQGVTREDACAREIAYMSYQGKPSISPGTLKLTAVNYTGLLHNMYSVFGAQCSTSDATNAELIVDYWTNTVKSYYQDVLLPGGEAPMIISAAARRASEPALFAYTGGSYSSFVGSRGGGTAAEQWISGQLSGSGYTGTARSMGGNIISNAQAAFDLLKVVAPELSEAAMIGLVANLMRESNMSTTAKGDNGQATGLVQWHPGRWQKVQGYGYGDPYALSTQVKMMVTEFKNDYAPVWNQIKQLGNTEADARRAADLMLHGYEQSADTMGTKLLGGKIVDPDQNEWTGADYNKNYDNVATLYEEAAWG